MRFFSRQETRAELETYLAATRRRWDKRALIDETRFVVLDVETTGFNIQKDRILSIAALPVEGKQCAIGDLQSWIIYQPDVEVTPATKIHTILPSETSQGVSESDALLELLSILEGAIVVGHHVGFDAAMLNHALQKHFNTVFRNPILDTAKMAMLCMDSFKKTGYSNQRPPGLDEVCVGLGLPLWGRHTADGDTFATAQLFLLLRARLARRHGDEMPLKKLPISKSGY